MSFFKNIPEKLIDELTLLIYNKISLEIKNEINIEFSKLDLEIYSWEKKKAILAYYPDKFLKTIESLLKKKINSTIKSLITEKINLETSTIAFKDMVIVILNRFSQKIILESSKLISADKIEELSDAVLLQMYKDMQRKGYKEGKGFNLGVTYLNILEKNWCCYGISK